MLRQLMKKKLFKSIAIIVAVAVVGLASTQALFRDVEKSQQGVFVVGTLDMNVEDESGQVAESIVVSNVGEQSTLSGGKTWTVKNAGSLPGRLTFQLTNIRNYENGCNEPEEIEDSTCGNPGELEGELGAAINTAVSYRQGQTEQTAVNANLATDAVNEYLSQWQANAGNVVVPPGGQVEVSFSWSADEFSFGNEVQSDSVMFDVVFELEQIVPGV